VVAPTVAANDATDQRDIESHPLRPVAGRYKRGADGGAHNGRPEPHTIGRAGTPDRL